MVASAKARLESKSQHSAVRLYNGMLAASAGAGELGVFVNTRTRDEGTGVASIGPCIPGAKAH